MPAFSCVKSVEKEEGAAAEVLKGSITTPLTYSQ